MTYLLQRQWLNWAWLMVYLQLFRLQRANIINISQHFDNILVILYRIFCQVTTTTFFALLLLWRQTNVLTRALDASVEGNEGSMIGCSAPGSWLWVRGNVAGSRSSEPGAGLTSLHTNRFGRFAFDVNRKIQKGHYYLSYFLEHV